MQSISQIRFQLNHLSHVSLQYSSTLISYKMIMKILEILKSNIQGQISNRFQEMKNFSTEQGIGLRKIMLQHYQKLNIKIVQEYEIFSQFSSNIFKKHKSMQSSLKFIEPIINELEYKQIILKKQLNQINNKFQRILEQKGKIYNKIQDYIQEKILLNKGKNDEQQRQSEMFSIFSIKNLQSFQTEDQLQQIHSLLQLKLEQIQEFIKIQKKLTKKTIDKIIQIFDEILGKGLQKMQNSLLSKIRENVQISHLKTQIKISKQTKQQEGQQKELDLRCYQRLQEVLNFKTSLQNINKRLFLSSQIQGVQLTQSIQEQYESEQNEEIPFISPTFKDVPALILQDQNEINGFDTQIIQDQKEQIIQDYEFEAAKISEGLYGSFSKQNLNILNFGQLK